MNTPQGRLRKVIKYLDWLVFVALLGFLVLIVFTSGRANIQTDAIDYYVILQRVVDKEAKPLVRGTPFVEQRSPGYPLVSAIPYYLTGVFIEPFVETEKVASPSLNPRTSRPASPGTERLSLPMQPLRFIDVFFKDYYFEPEGSWFAWRIISSLLFASYFMLFAGIAFAAKTMLLSNRELPGVSLIMLAIFTSSMFMHNIINTPAYATLTAFGISAIFCWSFVKSHLEKSVLTQFLSGLFLGLLVLTRLETIVIMGTVLVYLAFLEDKRFLRNFLAGAALTLGIFLLYNYLLFGTVFHLGILRGDINQIRFDWRYIVANILNPQSGILFWSPLVVLGIIGLFLGKRDYLTVLGISSLLLIGLVLVRVPAMYDCIGEKPLNIGGLLITCPRDMHDALMLIRSDANRYVTVLTPFSTLGLRALIGGAYRLIVRPGPAARAA